MQHNQINSPTASLNLSTLKLYSDAQLFEAILTKQLSRDTNLGSLIIQTLQNAGTYRFAQELEGLDKLNEDDKLVAIATVELIRRHSTRSTPRITAPSDVYSLCRHISLSKQEHFICISLSGSHDVMALRTVTIGILNQAQTHPREIFADLITDRAAATIVAHNHPSNNLEPSKSDIALTQRLAQAGQLLGIPLLALRKGCPDCLR
jgi:DNA repair protein RadC